MKKVLVILLLFACITGTVLAGGLTYDQANYKRYYANGLTAFGNDPIYNFINEVDTMLDGTGTSTITNLLFDSSITSDPTSTEGRLYYNSSTKKFKFYNASTWVTIEAGSSGNSLDGAYDVGRTISVDAGSVILTASNAADNVALSVIQSDTGATVAQTITSASTGALLSFDSNGTGGDLLGSDSTWSMSKAGVLVFVGGTTTGDITITGSAADIAFDVSDDELIFNDDAVLSLGTGADITLVYDGTDLLIEAAAADDVVKLGATTNFDVIVYGDTATDLITFDTSAEDVQFNGFDLTLQDSDILNFGDADDIAITWDGTDLLVEGAAADTIIKVGATNNQDIIVYGDTATDLITFDTSAELVTFNGFDINPMDDDVLAFGDGKDVIISQSSANLLTVGQTVAGTGSVAFGVDDAGLDVKLFGDTASAYFLWDTSADTVEMVGGNVTFTTDDAEANQFKVNATGAVAGIAVQLETTDGGIHLLADGATGGDITLDAEDDIVLTTTGKLTITNTEAVTISGALTVAGATGLNGAVLGDGGDSLYGVLSEIEIEPATSETLTAADSGKVFTNTAGQTITTFTLPAAAAGLTFTFCDISAVAGEDVSILAVGDDTINGGTAAKRYECTTDAIPQAVTLTAIDATQWIVTSEVGTWANNNS